MMKKIIIGCLLMGFCFGLLAAPELIEKTYTGKVSLLSKTVKGKKLTGYYLISGKERIRLPKPKADMDLSKFKDQTVTVVLKGADKKIKTKKGETQKFYAKEIVSMTAAEEKKE